MNLDSILHFFKHALGLCGEPHPSLLMGGFGIFTYCLYCAKNIKNCQKSAKNVKNYQKSGKNIKMEN